MNIEQKTQHNCPEVVCEQRKRWNRNLGGQGGAKGGGGKASSLVPCWRKSVVGEARVGAPSALGGSSQDLAQESGSSTRLSRPR